MTILKHADEAMIQQPPTGQGNNTLHFLLKINILKAGKAKVCRLEKSLIKVK